MTIDLGFAWLTLPSGREVSIVDVPGHERFIKNMLAGVGGIDVALLVVAADEGVMPQTREHLAILDLLGVARGVVVLTKRDLVDDDWLALVRDGGRRALAGTTLAGAPIVRVLGRDAATGWTSCSRALDGARCGCRRKRDAGRPRLPIDRVFTIGRLRHGRDRHADRRHARASGEEVEARARADIARPRPRPADRTATRSSRRCPARASPSTSAASTTDELHRGMVLTTPGSLRPTDVIDVRLRAVDALRAPAAPQHARDAPPFARRGECAAAPARSRRAARRAKRPGRRSSSPTPIAARARRPLRPAARRTTRSPAASSSTPRPKRHRRGDAATLTRSKRCSRTRRRTSSSTPSRAVRSSLSTRSPTRSTDQLRRYGTPSTDRSERQRPRARRERRYPLRHRGRVRAALRARALLARRVSPRAPTPRRHAAGGAPLAPTPRPRALRPLRRQRARHRARRSRRARRNVLAGAGPRTAGADRRLARAPASPPPASPPLDARPAPRARRLSRRDARRSSTRETASCSTATRSTA